MDFVVFGFGLGAFAVLVGLGLRDLGPLLRRVPRRGDPADLPWSEVGRRVAWGRTCRAAGLVVTLGGAALCLVTLLVLVAGAGDDVGMGLVLGALAVAVLAGVAWAALFLRQGDPSQAAARRPAVASRDPRRRSVGATTVAAQGGAGHNPGTAARSGAGRRRPAGGPPTSDPAARPRPAALGAASEPSRPGRVDPRAATDPMERPGDPDAQPAELAPRRVERGR